MGVNEWDLDQRVRDLEGGGLSYGTGRWEDLLPLLIFLGGCILLWFTFKWLTGRSPSPGWSNVIFFGSMIMVWVLLLGGFLPVR